MNKYGAAGAGGINPLAVIHFLDTRLHTVQRKGRDRLALNGSVVSDNDKRTMRRWRRNTKGINEQAFVRFLNRYGLTLKAYLRTTKTTDLTPYL